MPNRILKESICTSETLTNLSWFDQCVFFRLIVMADDFGRFDARPAIIKGRGFPLYSLTDKQIVESLSHLATAGIVNLYDVGGRPYLQLETWDKHQSVRAKKSKYPEPCKQLKSSANNCMQMKADSPVIQSNPERERERYICVASAPHTQFQVPTLDEVREYCGERKNRVDPERFIAFYESKGWMIGKNKMKDWRAAVRTWEKNTGKNDTPGENHATYDIDEYDRMTMQAPEFGWKK